MLTAKNVAIFFALATTAFTVSTIVLAVEKADLEDELQDALDKLDMMSTSTAAPTTASTPGGGGGGNSSPGPGETTSPGGGESSTPGGGETSTPGGGESTGSSSTVSSSTSPSGPTVPAGNPTFPTLPTGLPNPAEVSFKIFLQNEYFMNLLCSNMSKVLIREYNQTMFSSFPSLS